MNSFTYDREGGVAGNLPSLSLSPEYVSVSHWGMFPYINETRRRIDKLVYPVMEQIVNVRINA